MRDVKRIAGLMALTLTISAAMSAQTVSAAGADSEQIVSENTSSDTTSSNDTSNSNNVSNSDDSNSNDVSSSNTDSANNSSDNDGSDDSDSGDNNLNNVSTDTTDITDDTTDASNNNLDAASAITYSTDVIDTAAISTVSLFAVNDTNAVAALSADDTAQKKEAYAYTTFNANNCYDGESMKNKVDLTGDPGEDLSAIFKINFVGALTVDNAFKGGDDLTSYCTNLPEGLKLEKYTSNGHCSFMRVQLSGNATHGGSVLITIPKEKLLDRNNGYYIPDNGLSVTVYLTINGQDIPVTVPIATASHHEHKYSWKTLKACTDSQDGLEGYTCDTCGDVDSTRVISAYGMWLDSVTEQILHAEQDATVEIQTNIWNTYSKSVMDALETRSDVTLVTTFGEGEEAVTFTIPAGTTNTTTIVEEATALAASVDDASVAPAAEQQDNEWFGVSFLSSRYN